MGFHKPISLPSKGIVSLSSSEKRPATSAATDQPPTKKRAKERRNNKTEQKQPGVNSNAQPPPTVTIKQEKEELIQVGKRRTKDDAPLFVVLKTSGIHQARLPQEPLSLNNGVSIEIKEDENNWLSFKKEEHILIVQRNQDATLLKPMRTGRNTLTVGLSRFVMKQKRMTPTRR